MQCIPFVKWEYRVGLCVQILSEMVVHNVLFKQMFNFNRESDERII
jgi:hypothetical protein